MEKRRVILGTDQNLGYLKLHVHNTLFKSRKKYITNYLPPYKGDTYYCAFD